MLHNSCNYSCSYCPPSSHEGSEFKLEFEKVIGFLDQVFAHYKKDTYHFSFSGGEPTLWKGFEPLCQYLAEKNCQLGMTSNGSRPLSYWKKIQDSFNWLCLSFHPASARVEHFAQVVEFMSDKTRLAVRLMMPKDKTLWDKSMAMAERLRQVKGGMFHVEFVPILNDFGSATPVPEVYEGEQAEFFKGSTFFYVNENAYMPALVEKRPQVWDYFVEYSDGKKEYCRPNDMVAHSQTQFKGWTCSAGLDLLYIRHSGLIFRGNCLAGDSLGHIYDEKVAFPVKKIICPKVACYCGTDIQVRKKMPTKNLKSRRQNELPAQPTTRA
jgi:organic radical activating enzyme